MLQCTTGPDPCDAAGALFGAGGFAVFGGWSVATGQVDLADVPYSKGAVFGPTMDTQSCANVVKTELSRQRCECRRNRLDVDEG